MALLLMPFSGKAQHLYYRMDVATNNIYTFAAANLATAGINALTDEMLFDNAYTYTYTLIPQHFDLTLFISS